MRHTILWGTLLLVLLLPDLATAKPSTEELAFRNKIKRLAGLIMATDYESQVITARGRNEKDALIKATETVHTYLKSFKLDPTLCQCLEQPSFVTNGEYMLMTLWKDVIVQQRNSQKGRIDLSVKLNKKHLVQLALYHLWTLQDMTTWVELENVNTQKVTGLLHNKERASFLLTTGVLDVTDQRQSLQD